MSLRARLTLLYSIVLGTTLLLLAVLLYIFMYTHLMSNVDKQLQQQTNEVLRSSQIVKDFPLEKVVLPNVNVFSAPDTYIQAINTNGEIVARSKNLFKQTLPVSVQDIRKGREGNEFFKTFTYKGNRLRVINHPLILNNNYLGIIQVGRSLAAVDEALNRLKLLLIFGSLIGLLVASSSGWYLAKIALKPITRISEIATEIAETGDMTRRINYEGVRDELGNLADTFDAMVEKLHEAYTKLQENYTAQKRFLADASHELRTPLTTIKGNIEFLQKIGDTDSEMAKEIVDDIESETQRMSRLVQDLLALARADSGYELDKENSNLYDILHKVIRAVDKWNISTQFTTSQIEESTDVDIYGNSDYLQEAFLILLDNAFKYTSAAGKVSLEVVYKDSSEIAVAVIDTGAGIPQEEIPHIFSRFYRTSSSRKKKGTGLGLAICYWIIKQHNGNIEVESELQKGSRFTVKLPRSE